LTVRARILLAASLLGACTAAPVREHGNGPRLEGGGPPVEGAEPAAALDQEPPREQEPPPQEASPTGGAQAGTAKPEGTAREEVLLELRAYYKDFSARDWRAFADHFWPGATITTIWQPEGEPKRRVVITPLDRFVAEAAKGPGSREIFEEWMIDAQVDLSEDLAQVWASYGARFGDPGEVMEWKGIDAFTLLKQEGRWRIVSLVYGDGTSGR
jgi:hypothetical protein